MVFAIDIDTGHKALCPVSKHDSVKLRGKDSPSEDLKRAKRLCGLYGEKLAYKEPVEGQATDMAMENSLSETQLMTQHAFDEIYGHAQEHGYQKEGGVVMRVNPKCKYDYKGNEMTFESFYNHVKALNPRLQHPFSLLLR